RLHDGALRLELLPELGLERTERLRRVAQQHAFAARRLQRRHDALRERRVRVFERIAGRRFRGRRVGGRGVGRRRAAGGPECEEEGRRCGPAGKTSHVKAPCRSGLCLSKRWPQKATFTPRRTRRPSRLRETRPSAGPTCSTSVTEAFSFSRLYTSRIGSTLSPRPRRKLRPSRRSSSVWFGLRSSPAGSSATCWLT